MSHADAAALVFDLLRALAVGLGILLAAGTLRLAYLRYKSRHDTWPDYLAFGGMAAAIAFDQFVRIGDDDGHVTWRLPVFGLLVLVGCLSMRRRLRLGPSGPPVPHVDGEGRVRFGRVEGDEQ